jgi:hypothetical protein
VLRRPMERVDGPGLLGTAARTAAVPDDRISQLQELAALRSNGVLTEDEFQREKSRILRG